MSRSNWPPNESGGSVTKDSPPRERSSKSVETILRYYSQYLSEYERREIAKYEQIYFFGPHAKKVKGTCDNPILNYGYDDERGDYHLVAHDQLAYRYEILKRLGRGSFGQVVKCLDHKTGEYVAIKLVRNKRRFQGQALTEVRILKKLVEWDPDDRHHNIRMIDYFYFRDHMCVVFECLSMNLYEFIKSNDFQGFSLSLIRRFAIQILKSLYLLEQHKVIHCDLKPENILLKHPSKSTIKVIDFGSSCFENEKVYTYIQSRFYRAPEVILGITYGRPIDMWSLGCILAELYAGVPLFPGDTEQDQLGCIMEVLGVPPRHIIEQSTRHFDGRPRPFVSAHGKKRKPGSKTLLHMLRGCPDIVFVDFIKKCLRWDPSRRMQPQEAFHHEWIAQQLRTSTDVSKVTEVRKTQPCIFSLSFGRM
ncbi:kinase-like domain-containing protein [Dichotomocladium elegans]|nr:kinase-like domain-containing protein [Dichotomocladium elegans]